MADYAGAVAAIIARLRANWTTTPVQAQNEQPPQEPWPPQDGNGSPTPWVYVEVIGNESSLRGIGLPGNQAWLYLGHVLAHVFVPTGTGTELAHQYAVSIGEIFRAKAFYSDTPPNMVRTWSPRTDGGGIAADNGNWFRVTMTCPFEFYYQG